MQVTELGLDGVKLILPDVFHDNRGYFIEAYNASRYFEAGMRSIFVQDNRSRSFRNVIRGLHFQMNPAQAKLVQVTQGEIWDVVVDIRPKSQTFGKWIAESLSAANYRQLYIPAGFAHGFCAMSDIADIMYKVDSLYTGGGMAIAFDDPELAIDWPTKDPIISVNDSNSMSFADYINMFKN